MSQIDTVLIPHNSTTGPCLLVLIGWLQAPKGTQPVGNIRQKDLGGIRWHLGWGNLGHAMLSLF